MKIEMWLPKGLAETLTLPSSWYTNPRMLELEQEEIFSTAWQWVGTTENLKSVGDFITCTVANQPLVVVHSEDHQLRCFYNVCQHRAGNVAKGCGNRKTLQCKYHAWTYDLHGKLLKAPEMEGVSSFCKENIQLKEVRLEKLANHLFVCLAEEPIEFSTFVGKIPEEIQGLQIERFRLFQSKDYEIACNWKVYVDNYLEGYHIPAAHPGLLQEVDYQQYWVETFGYYSKQHSPIRKTKDSLYLRNLPETEAPQALYYWMYPNLMFNLYPDNLQINVIEPISPTQTRTRFLWFWKEPERAEAQEEFQKSFAFSHQVQLEDIEICENVQKGLASKAYQQGYYSKNRENGVYHFHCLLQQNLQGSL